MTRDFRKRVEGDARRTITQDQKGRNLVKVPAEMKTMIRVAIVTSQLPANWVSYPVRRV